MAGIGFVLRKLIKKGDLLGAAQAYMHAVFASSGPWVFTIITIWAFYFIGDKWGLSDKIEIFRVVILYNFSFSLVLTAPIVMLSTRYLADCIFRVDLTEASGLMIGSLVLQYLATFPLACFFYFYLIRMEFSEACFAVMNFLLISGVWITMVFISALKYYTAITWTFIVGLSCSGIFAYILSSFLGLGGLILGFNIGLAIILSSFVALIIAEYPRTYSKIFSFIGKAKQYWIVLLSGTCYNLAIWIDKWIMWFAPERRELSNGMILYPEYDVSMFVAYLTIIPAMAFFLLSQETSFFEKYITYYRGILEHDTLRKISKNHRSMMENIFYHGRNLLILQGAVCFFTLLMAPRIMDFLGMNLVQISIFRYGVLGATFQILSLFFIILLSYFDDRKGAFLINAIFLSTNTLFTLACLYLGFPFYGIGYCFSAICTFAVAVVVSERYMSFLPYHTFITRNLQG